MSHNHRLFQYRHRQENGQQFTLFPNLAPEVRIMIWECAVADAEPRLVEFFTKDYEEQRELKVRHQTPALLRVSKEPRYVTLKAYPTFLDNKTIFLEPGKDVVFMQDWTIPKIYHMWMDHKKDYIPKVENKVRNLVVAGKERYPTMGDIEKCGFYNLEKIILEKSEGSLTPRQEAHLFQNTWKHLPRPGNGLLFEKCNHQKKLKLSFLTEEGMNREVSNSNEAQGTSTDNQYIPDYTPYTWTGNGRIFEITTNNASAKLGRAGQCSTCTVNPERSTTCGTSRNSRFCFWHYGTARVG
jgi:hypothetical protein